MGLKKKGWKTKRRYCGLAEDAAVEICTKTQYLFNFSYKCKTVLNWLWKVLTHITLSFSQFLHKWTRCPHFHLCKQLSSYCISYLLFIKL